MAKKDQPVVLIAGSGIGGLAAALGLASKGVKTTVLEKAAKFGEIGAGFELGPNALGALDYLGVGDAARDVGVYVSRLVLMDAVSGREIFHVPVKSDRFVERFGNPWATMHRNDLHNVMLTAARQSYLIELHTGCEVTGYDQSGAQVTAKTAAGDEFTGAALVAADGMWSNVRRQMIGDELNALGHTAYRALIPSDHIPAGLDWLRDTTTLWAGPKCHVITYPLSGTRLINLVLVSTDKRYAPPGPVAGAPISNEEVYARFDHTHPRVKGIFTLAPEFKLWAIGDRDPAPKWVDGRVALLGDAAHPMMQYVAQGACQALEDAVCLAHAFETWSGDIDRAFSEYEKRRTVRTARVQILSRAVGEHIYHPCGPHADVRDAILSRMSIEEFYDRMIWLWGGNGINSQAA
ncbi:salicylate hydroxylase [Bradyrhizobium sp. NAS80.1]|uniref:FAD-dependent monooxygenase n=1 Tax=Bradyrhizobium sp. NAS80.1 TaxID=1680159 RepID=UPI00095CE702|nr:FAD-dependent monooxygenase [Bradyrhizobium sp. NAS80.1]OKO86282.1 salicylate hydroxylase [Bradyrhizobium sp. NAS80.1]